MFDYFICYQIESGWHVTRPNQGLSLGRGESLGTRLQLIAYPVSNISDSSQEVKPPYTGVSIYG